MIVKVLLLIKQFIIIIQVSKSNNDSYTIAYDKAINLLKGIITEGIFIVISMKRIF